VHLYNYHINTTMSVDSFEQLNCFTSSDHCKPI